MGVLASPASLWTSVGLASFIPVTSRMAARHDRGIRFNQVGKNSTLTSSKTP